MEHVGNKEVARRFFDERWNRKNLAICDELLAPSFDIEAHKAWVRSFHASFGDIQLDILALIAEGDQVAVHWRLVATHQGEYLGVAATGRRTTNQGITLLRIVDGRIVEDTGYWDRLAQLEQLGALPAEQSGARR
jgi:predicted ester cyclase